MGSRRRREREQQEMWLEFQTYQQQRCANCPIYMMFNDMLRQQQMQAQQTQGPGPGAAAGPEGQLGAALGGMNTDDIWKTLNLPPELDILRKLFMNRATQRPTRPPVPGPFAPMAGAPMGGPPMGGPPMGGPPMGGPMPQQPRKDDEDEDHH